MTFFPNIKEQTSLWHESQLDVWQKVIENALAIGEINTNLKPQVIKYMFADIYLGRSFSGVFTKSGCDIDLLEEIFNSIYSVLKQ